jgi:hypothetical protein
MNRRSLIFASDEGFATLPNLTINGNDTKYGIIACGNEAIRIEKP